MYTTLYRTFTFRVQLFHRASVLCYSPVSSGLVLTLMSKEGGWFYSRRASQLKDVMAQDTQVCGRCGAINAPNMNFCYNCGYAFIKYAVISNMATAMTVGSLMSPDLILSQRYRIAEMIGKGGFGAVYKATDERFQRRIVAIKEMSDSQLSPRAKVKALQDFHKEANLLEQLKHPHLPDVSDVFEEGGKAYLVMEFIEGKTLAKLQDEQNGPLDERLIMGWALQLCTVLHYLHTRPQPIIFRDMKPTNVMVTADGQIKLIDFGIARIFKTAVKKDTTQFGSLGYAPLEQYGHGQSDARSDIYALGATLYNLLTKSLPVDAPSRRINPTLFSPPRQLNPRISPAVEAIILKAMAEDPPDRYQTAIDMYRAIVDTGLVNTAFSPPSLLPNLLGAQTTLASPQTSNSVYPNQPPSATPSLSPSPPQQPSSAVAGTLAQGGKVSRRSSPLRRNLLLLGGVLLVVGFVILSLVLNMNHEQILNANTASHLVKKWAFQTGSFVHSSPAVVDGVVYVGSKDHNVYALDAQSGKQRWVFPTEGMVDSSPAVVNGMVYVGSNDKNVYAIDVQSGQKKWAFSTMHWVSSSPTVVNNVVYVGSWDGNLYAFGLP